MRCKELGQTGVMIPEIGLGTWQYKGGSELIRRAVERGLCLIDTAESYQTEDLVGKAIRGMRDRVFIATKTSHWRYQDVLRSADQSLRRLGIQTIDLYQVHWPNVTVPIAETMSAMEDLVDHGKVRFIGLSNFIVPEMKKAQAALRKYKIVSNQMRYSLVERSIERAVLPYCQQAQITVIAYSPLGHSFQHVLAADPKGVLGEIAGTTGRTKAQVALNWCIARPGVVAIPKTESLQHLLEDLDSSGWRLSEHQLDRLDRNILFRTRGPLETALRRFVRGMLQRLKGAVQRP